MRTIIIILILAYFSVSCTVYNQVILDEETIIYDKSGSEANALYTIPQGSLVYLTGKKKYKKIKYGVYEGWTFNPLYTTSSSTNNSSNTTRSTSSSSNKTVNVKGYYRKNGTYVKPHTRSSPRKK